MLGSWIWWVKTRRLYGVPARSRHDDGDAITTEGGDPITTEGGDAITPE